MCYVVVPVWSDTQCSAFSNTTQTSQANFICARTDATPASSAVGNLARANPARQFLASTQNPPKYYADSKPSTWFPPGDSQSSRQAENGMQKFLASLYYFRAKCAKKIEC